MTQGPATIRQEIPHSCPTLDEADRAAVVAVLQSKQIAAGSMHRLFTEALAVYLGQNYGGLFSSGASALFHVLRALGILSTDDVLLPTYICDSVLRAVRLAGGRPVLYDNDPGAWVGGLGPIRKALTAATRAVIISHTFGIRFHDLEELEKLGVPIIEDCAHAFATHLGGKKIAQHSLCSVYSFQATKCLAVGEGGAVACRDAGFFQKLQACKIDAGLSDLSCALGLSQLGRYDHLLARRRAIAQFYFEALPGISTPLRREDSMYFRFPVLVQDPTPFFRSRVAFRKGVDTLLHRLPGLEHFDCPNAEAMFAQTVSLPLYPSLEQAEAEAVVAEVSRILNQG